LKKQRERERGDAIAKGFLADPDKPRTLAEAITPVGTCPDMCAEFERVERMYQNDVWPAENVSSHGIQKGQQDKSGDDDNNNNTPAEHRMVKKFRRAAAGIDEQLPSDLRPPAVLKKTCDYLFNHVIGNADSLGAVHLFVWDRTRAIRNDFSIQQVTKPADLEIAIECYERIARFHILSLHQLALPEKPYDRYDWYQEREQLDRTLLSLMQYYDDTKGRFSSPNEAEFRAYCVVFQAQDPTPDLEERVNCWEWDVKSHPRIRKALDLYNAACNILDPQGPLKPRAVHPVAQEDWRRFFALVKSNSISYLMACVSEIYFNLMRRAALNAIWRAFKPQSSKHDVTDFTLPLMTTLLGFDDYDQTEHFCQRFGFVFKEIDGAHSYLDLNS
ncbi:SAC3/GANP/Nin1/mts3/eIF-3 p25 family-domain-containing protein, partial [Delphinella strobiligena]